MLIQFDAEPQQMTLRNLQTGLQIVATINMEDLIDGVATSEESTALALGRELIGLLKKDGKLISSIDPIKQLNDVCEIVDTDTLTWDAQVMYEHKGFGTQIKDIGPVLGNTPEEARDAARREFEKNMAEYADEDCIEKWDVRVRPAQK